MTAGILVGLVLFSATSGIAATPGFVLGVDYSEPAPPEIAQIETDGLGALYILSGISNGDIPNPGVPLPNRYRYHHISFRLGHIATGRRVFHSLSSFSPNTLHLTT
jgi:hypothetical protein